MGAVYRFNMGPRGMLGAGLAGGVYGLVNIESDYDSIWYMRHDSYPYQYFKALGDHFQGQGERVDVYLGKNICEPNISF